MNNNPNTVTRRQALSLLGASIIAIPMSKHAPKPPEFNTEEAFSRIERWNGEILDDRELKEIFIAVWPTIHSRSYYIKNLPCGVKLRDFFGCEHMTRLLRSLGTGSGNGFIYSALDLSLQRVTSNGGLIAVMWCHYTIWMKRSIIRCFDTEITDLEIARKRFELTYLQNYCRLKA